MLNGVREESFNIEHSPFNIQHFAFDSRSRNTPTSIASSASCLRHPTPVPTIIRAMFVLYEVLLYLVLIAALPYFVVTGMLRGKYLANFPERMGFYKTTPAAHDLWIHAVSVGETLAARPVVDEILRKRPSTTIVGTTTTITGQGQARRLFPAATVADFQ